MFVVCGQRDQLEVGGYRFGDLEVLLGSSVLGIIVPISIAFQ
jgi:hypothetical protein